MAASLNVRETVSLSCELPPSDAVTCPAGDDSPSFAFRISAAVAMPRCINARTAGPRPACTAAWGMLHDPHTSILKNAADPSEPGTSPATSRPSIDSRRTVLSFGNSARCRIHVCTDPLGLAVVRSVPF
jgi:hypothetical protein